MANTRIFTPAPTAGLPSLTILVLLGICCVTRAEDINVLRNVWKGHGEVVLVRDEDNTEIKSIWKSLGFWDGIVAEISNFSSHFNLND